VRKVHLNAPQIRYVSCVTGTWITPEQATDPAYWTTHFRRPVRFSDALKTLRQETPGILLETGPGTTLQTLARQHGTMREGELAPGGPPHQVRRETDQQDARRIVGFRRRGGLESFLRQ